MTQTRDNHYVPQWYQRGFLLNKGDQLHYLDLTPDQGTLPDGRVITFNSRFIRPTSTCFYQTDLYTTFFGNYINDEIERRLFGEIDNVGSKAVGAFISDNISAWHHNFQDFFSYIDAQKIRTPKGLDWIKSHYPKLGQDGLMVEMQAIRQRHCTIWAEGVREIVSAHDSEVKFIISDHPVTIYNYACPPENGLCTYPNEPSIALKGTQTIFPLDMNHCLILTNYEYAKSPDSQNPVENRTNARNYRNSMVRTDAFIRSRELNADEVIAINYVLKARARRYVAAPVKEWLYPEQDIQRDWSDIRHVLLPPEEGLWQYGGEMFAGFDDGRTYYQDAFGRTTPENTYLKKPKRNSEPRPNDFCGCGSGKKYKKCCRDKLEAERPSWDVMSIRERNMAFFKGVIDILGISKGKSWEDIRRELSNDHVKKLHELYGFLWPLDTDITSLLPKPDKSLRALYTGMIDPRLISRFALGLTPYFDEIIIQHPFLNPAAVRPESSPVESPHQHKQQTLKNIMLFMMLAPFIEMGYVNFIPDICFFDQYLQRQMFDMARARAQGHQIGDEEEERVFKELAKEDFDRIIYMLSPEQRRDHIKRANPNLSEEKLEQVLEYLEIKRQADPFTLLQDNVYGPDGGQLSMMTMAPNFEISLYIAQITGSILLTDSPYRWSEINNAQYREAGVTHYPWKELTDLMSSYEYPLNANPEETFLIRNSGKLGSFRKAHREMHTAVKEHGGQPTNSTIEAHKRNIAQAYNSCLQELPEKGEYSLDGKISHLIPKGGIVHNNVQRMLLTSGVENALRSVPMAVYAEPFH